MFISEDFFSIMSYVYYYDQRTRVTGRNVHPDGSFITATSLRLMASVLPC